MKNCIKIVKVFFNYCRILISNGNPKGFVSSCSVVANVLECDIVVREFELQGCYCFHFWTNTIGKGMNPLIPPAMG